MIDPYNRGAIRQALGERMFYAPQRKHSSMAIELGITESVEGRMETGKIQLLIVPQSFKSLQKVASSISAPSPSVPVIARSAALD